LTSEHAREIGHRNKADLVIWGRPLFSNKFKLNCLAVNPVWEMHHGSWSLDFHLEEVEEESSAVNIQLKHTCYWCLFNRSFFGRDYQECYDFLIKALELAVESFEIQMR